MRQEVFEIVQKMDKDNIRTQMALQCAPLITGLKSLLERFLMERIFLI